MQPDVFKARIVLRKFPISTQSALRTQGRTKTLRALRLLGSSFSRLEPGGPSFRKPSPAIRVIVFGGKWLYTAFIAPEV